MIFLLASALLIPAILTLVLTPMVARLALIVGAIDRPDERKLHVHATPRLGGVAVFASVALSLTTVCLIKPALVSSWVSRGEGIALSVSVIAMLAI